MEGRLWGFWVLCGCCCVERRCGVAAPCCFSCCQPVPIPQQKHQKKITVGQPREIFFFTCDETSKWSHLFLFALAHRFIHFELF